MFEIPKDENVDKKVVNELLNPERLYFESRAKGGLKKPKSDIIERKDDKLLTSDGRELFNENK